MTSFYLSYGCFCGPTMYPKPYCPANAFDQACLEHDQCYHDTYTKTNRSGSDPCGGNADTFFDHYSWHKEDNGQVSFQLFSIFTRLVKTLCQIVCSSSNDECESALCQCDKVFVETLRWVESLGYDNCPKPFKGGPSCDKKCPGDDCDKCQKFYFA